MQVCIVCEFCYFYPVITQRYYRQHFNMNNYTRYVHMTLPSATVSRFPKSPMALCTSVGSKLLTWPRERKGS